MCIRDRGTTTDPVQKAMELLPIGPVVIIDTPGIDDELSLIHIYDEGCCMEKSQVLTRDPVLPVSCKQGIRRCV